MGLKLASHFVVSDHKIDNNNAQLLQDSPIRCLQTPRSLSEYVIIIRGNNNFSTVYSDNNNNYYHFVGHCGTFYGLKWRIWQAKMYFSMLK